MYIKWLLYAVADTLISFICYITNPIVVLFCDDDGELPGVLSLWQTWDDSVDSAYFMRECVPHFLDYGYDDKYKYVIGTTDALAAVNRIRAFSVLRDGATFTMKERIQRYICRVLWLTRNCGYGFAFWIFGANVNGADMTYTTNTDDTSIGDDGRHFIVHSDAPIFACGPIVLRWKVFTGWKISSLAGVRRCMLANRPLIALEWEG